MEQSKTNVNHHSVIFALLHVVTYVPTAWLLKNQVVDQPVSLILVTVPVITFVIFIFKYIQALSLMDEVKQRVQLEAVVIGFSLTTTLAMLLFLLSLCNISNPTWFSYGYMVGYCWAFYFIGWGISKKKYGI